MPDNTFIIEATVTQYELPPPPVPTIWAAGTDARFPVRRTFCVSRNYAAHAREMGRDGVVQNPPAIRR